MGTAVLVRDGVGGFPAPASLYQVDPPLNGADHLLVYYLDPMYGQRIGQICVLAATANGAVFTPTMEPQEGTRFTNNPDHARALSDAGYELVEGVVEVPVDGVAVPPEVLAEVESQFDPSVHTVVEVNTYLSTADPVEAERVLEAERAGKSRIGILGKESD